MSILRFCFAFALFGFPFFAHAQTAEEAKEKAVREAAFVEQILTDAKNLRLAENRGFVYGKIGSLLWQSDEKRARRLFSDAVGELIAAQTEAEGERGNKQFLNNLLYGQSPRWEILHAIAARDADFALDAMAKTRPAKLVQALAQMSAEYQSMSRQYAKNEIQNEQRLMALAAEQNPQRAVKLLRESLKRDVSYETINLLRKIHQKDPETANAIAAEVAEKLLGTKLDDENQDPGFIQFFLGEFGREPVPSQPETVKVSEPLLRRLAEKIVKFTFRPGANSFYGHGEALKVIERFNPVAAAEIKERQAKFQNQTGQNQNYAKLMQSETPPEMLLSQARKFPASQRAEIYRRAAEKTAQAGDVSGAQSILTGNLPEEHAEHYISQLNYNLAQQAMREGKFGEAGALVNQIPDENQRFNALIQFAGFVYGKNPQENKAQAVEILTQARALIADAPEKLQDLNAMANLAASYAQIEPDTAFRLLESIVAPLNEFSEASAVLAKFNDYGNFRRGEYQLTSGAALGVYNFAGTLNSLKRKDFERTVQIVNGFSRPDVRLSLQLQLIDDFGGIQHLPIRGRSLQNFVINGVSGGGK